MRTVSVWVQLSFLGNKWFVGGREGASFVQAPCMVDTSSLMLVARRYGSTWAYLKFGCLQGQEKHSQARMKRFMTIMDSMTDKELDSSDPKLFSYDPQPNSRIIRVAKGSGSRIQQVLELLGKSSPEQLLKDSIGDPLNGQSFHLGKAVLPQKGFGKLRVWFNTKDKSYFGDNRAGLLSTTSG